MVLNPERCPLCGTELSGTKFKEIQMKLQEEEQKKAAAIRQQLEQQFKMDLAKQKQALEKKAKDEAEIRLKQVIAERDQTAIKLKQAETRETAVRKQITEDAEKERLKQLANQRQSLETDKKSSLLKQQSEFNRERESFQKKMLQMEKQLQKKTPNELGDGGEIDLYDALRDSFPTDKISRIQKGQPGADILHEILYKGTPCGRILVESKNRQDWKNSYVTKLRQDQVEAGAEHAILATTFFPPGKKEMCIESDVIVISPARVVYVTQLLRNAMVTMHVKGLSMKERSTKMVRLYKLITSESYSRKFAEASKLAEEILALDVDEKSTHDNVWKKRGSLAKRVQNVLREAETEVAAVIESIDDAEIPPAFSVKSDRSLSATSQTQEII